MFIDLIHNGVTKVFHGNNLLNLWRSAKRLKSVDLLFIKGTSFPGLQYLTQHFTSGGCSDLKGVCGVVARDVF